MERIESGPFGGDALGVPYSTSNLTTLKPPQDHMCVWYFLREMCVLEECFLNFKYVGLVHGFFLEIISHLFVNLDFNPSFVGASS